MNLGRAVKAGWLVSVISIPCFSKDWLFVTTNWNSENEHVLRIDPDDGRMRTLWHGGTQLDTIASPDGTRLYVTFIEDQRCHLATVDTGTGEILQKIETPSLIRWIYPSTPGMAISPDGRRLYLLKTRYSVGSHEYSLLMFDTREARFVEGERAISNCPDVRLLPAPGNGKLSVLCGRGTAGPQSDGDLVVRLEHLLNFAFSPGANALYVAGRYGEIQELDVATHVVLRTSPGPALHSRRIMPSSNTISPDGRYWYLPIKIAADSAPEIEQIQVFDTQSMSRASIITPVGPFWGLALSSDGRRLYASQQDLQNIMVIDTAKRQPIRVIPTGAKPAILLAVKAP